MPSEEVLTTELNPTVKKLEVNASGAGSSIALDVHRIDVPHWYLVPEPDVDCPNWLIAAQAEVA